jgi:hypothetical protein
MGQEVSSFNLEEAQVCAVLSSIVYDPQLGQGPSWDQLNRILRENADRYPPISHILKNLQVREGESSFDMACFSSPSTIYIVVRGTDFNGTHTFRDLLNDLAILVADTAVSRTPTCASTALQWKQAHAGKRVVCAGHSLGGTVALALMMYKVGDFAHVFNYGRGFHNVPDFVESWLRLDRDKILHHHIFGDLISPRYFAKVHTITYAGESGVGEHRIANFTNAVARGGWPQH